jgi:hypothetical protein
MLVRAEHREIAPGLRVLVPEIHDHAVLLTVNAFKDKIVTATAWALADLEHVVLQPAFRPDEFVGRVVLARISTLAWIVASWMESMRCNHAWAAIRVAIESCGHVRASYAHRFQRHLGLAHGAPMSLRLLARVAADSPLMQIRALALAVACSAEIRLRARLDL